MNDDAGQLRGMVCSLRAQGADGRPFCELLQELIDRTTAGHESRVLLDVDARIDALPSLARGNLLLLVIEKPAHVQNPGSPSRKRGDRHDANIQRSIGFCPPAGQPCAAGSE